MGRRYRRLQKGKAAMVASGYTRCSDPGSFTVSIQGRDVAWSRRPELKEYWFKGGSRVALNIDELVRGFERGLEEFRRLVKADPDLRTKFKEYILNHETGKNGGVGLTIDRTHRISIKPRHSLGEQRMFKGTVTFCAKIKGEPVTFPYLSSTPTSPALTKSK